MLKRKKKGKDKTNGEEKETCTVAVKFLVFLFYYFLLFFLNISNLMSERGEMLAMNASCPKKRKAASGRRRRSGRVQSRWRDLDISCLLEMFFIVCDQKKKQQHGNLKSSL